MLSRERYCRCCKHMTAERHQKWREGKAPSIDEHLADIDDGIMQECVNGQCDFCFGPNAREKREAAK